MRNVIASINKGFGNCLFINNDAKVVEGIMRGKINDTKLNVLPIKPIDIKVERIDALHDKLSLSFNEAYVEGTITWTHSANGRHYVFSKFEA